MNLWIALGRLTKDAEVKYTDNGKAVSTFTLAVNRMAAPDKPKATDFIRCVAFGKTAETIGNYVHKGQRLLVRGSIHTSSYTDKNGEKRYGTDIWVDKFTFIEKKEELAEQGPEKAVPQDISTFTKIGDVVADFREEAEE